MPELIVVNMRAGSWHEPAAVVLKDPVTERHLSLTASAKSAGARAAVSTGLVRDLLDAVGASLRHVEIGEASAGPDQVVLIVGEGVRVPTTLMEAVSLAQEIGVPIRCTDAVLAGESLATGEGVTAGEAATAGPRWNAADPAPTSAYRVLDLDATTQMEIIQPRDPGGQETPVALAPAGAAILQIRQGPGAGAVFGLEGNVITCGRDFNNEIVLDGATVSRKHAEFHRQDAGYTVADLDSLNGTYVNGERVKTAALAAGDEIRIGRYLLTFAAG